MAANKIYATIQGSQLLGCSINPYRDCEEFIRKDALVKWIESIRLEYDLREPFDRGADSAMEHVLQRINSL